MTRKVTLSNKEFYHIYNRGIERREIFEHEYDSLRFQMLLHLCNSSTAFNLKDLFSHDKSIESIFKIKVGEPLVSIGAYCLMPNHFHLLVRQEKENGISQFMQKLGTAYTMYFNSKNERTGSLFQGTFKARHAERDEYLKYLFAYIHLNPIKLIDPQWKENGISNIDRAKKYIEKYPYSSFAEYSGTARPQASILKKDAFPEYFSSLQDFNHFLSDWLNIKKNDAILSNLPEV